MSASRGAQVRLPRLLHPVLAVTDRLRMRARLLVLVAVLLVPTVLATGSFSVVMGGQVAFTAKERGGVALVHPAVEALTQVAAGRPVTLTRLRAAGQAYPLLADTATLRAVDEAVEASATAAVPALVELIRQVGDRSNLILDPDLDSFYAMDALVVQVPRILDAASGVAPANGVVDPDAQRSLQVATLIVAADAIRRDISTALSHTSRSSLARELQPVLDSADRAQQLAAVIAAAPAAAREQSARVAFADGTVAATASLAGALDGLLAQRAHTLNLRRDLTLLGTLAGLAVAVWIAAGVIWRTRSDVALTLAGVGAISDGDLQDRPLPGGQDEFGDIGRAVHGARGRLEQLLFRDPLTDLPNRPLFLERLHEALREDQQRGGLVSVLFIDLDRFKPVNDRLGHAAGDELLRAVAGRIDRCVGSGDTASRFGGDEFAVVLRVPAGPPDTARRAAIACAHRIIAAVREPFTIRGQSVHIGATVGIAHSDPALPELDADGLLASADLAMYDAKRDGGGQARTYDPQMAAVHLERLQLETELQDALPEGQLDVVYQPIVALRTGEPTGMEALLRWQRPRGGPVSPVTFIPLAEASGLIVEIGRWVLTRTCGQLAAWRLHHPALTCNVNVSVQQLADEAFVGDVERALRREGLPGSALVLEVTESLLLQDHPHVLARLHDLRALGVAIALDDFGTGYSCLAYLQRLPVDNLKIDRSFVSGPTSVGNDPLVRSIIELGHALDLSITAEGIETASQWARLSELGCRTGQGYHFARPLPILGATDYLRQGPHRLLVATAGSSGPATHVPITSATSP